MDRCTTLPSFSTTLSHSVVDRMLLEKVLLLIDHTARRTGSLRVPYTCQVQHPPVEPKSYICIGPSAVTTGLLRSPLCSP